MFENKFHINHITTRMILAGMVIMLAACSAVPTAEPVPQTSIIFMLPAEDEDFYTRLVGKFNQTHPEIKVELKPYVGRRPADQPWDVRIISRQIVFNEDDPADTEFMELDQFIAKDGGFDGNDYYPGTLESFSVEGKLKAMPFGVDPTVMFYNRDLFDLSQVSYPQTGWTWDEFLQKASAITVASQGVYGYVSGSNHEDAFFFIFQHGGRLMDESGKPTFTDPLTVEAVRWYGGLYYEYMVAPTPDTIGDLYVSNDATEAAIVSGRTGMWMGSYSGWQGDETVGAYKFKTGAAPLPVDQVPFTVATFSGYVISSQTASPDASWAWIKFLCDEVPYNLLPARRSQAESSTYESYVGANIAQAGRDAMASATLVSGFMNLDSFGNIELFMRAIEDVVNGDKTASEALGEAQALAER
jgi:ABC-type glycerol-3-phosphate transport system substrate-binding protein